MSRFHASVSREIDGQTWRLVMDFNAVCHFEEATGLNFFELMESWQSDGRAPSGTEMRHIMHAALKEHQPDATLQDAGRLLSLDMGCMQAVISAATAGLEVAEKKPKAARSR